MSLGPIPCSWCGQEPAMAGLGDSLCSRCRKGFQEGRRRAPSDPNLEADFESKGGGLEDSARYPGVGLSGPLSRYRERVREIPDPREEE